MSNLVKSTVPSLAATVALSSLTALSFSLLYSYPIHADNTVVDDVSVSIRVACNVNASEDEAHSATVNNGTYEDEIGTTTFQVLCNDNSGYSIYAVGYSNQEFGNTKLLANIGGSAVPTYDIVTGTNTSGGTSNWAMKLTATGSTSVATILNSFNAYHIVPDTYTKVATFASSTDMTIGSTIETTYATYISGTQPAGDYSGKVRYTLVHPASESAPLAPQPTVAGKICYYPNASTYEGTMGCQTVSTSAIIANLFASNFSRTGYGFAGWSDVYDYTTNPDAHFYGPNETISFTAGQYTGDNPGLSLYAVWVPSAGNFQDSAKVAELCGNGANALTAAAYNDEGDADESTWSITAGLSSVSALTDTRDGQTYAIAKLTDGNCWMIENLRLADTHQEGANTVPTTLTVANTNNPLNDDDPDNPTVTLKHNYTDSQTFTNLSATSNVAYDATTAPDGWCSSDNASCDNQSRLRTDNIASRVIYTNGQTMSTGANLYSYGNYYNWYSATAGRGTYSTGSGVVTTGDLCPLGWHLPYGSDGTGTKGGNTSGGFYYLAGSMVATSSNATSSEKHRSFPNNFVYSGYVSGASFSSIGTYGFYWSSTANSASRSYGLYMYSTVFYPGTTGSATNKYRGRAVRCVMSSGT